MATEDPKAQYAKMIEDFKKGVMTLLDQSKAGMDELEKGANTNFDGMSQAYLKGCGEMKAQILKGNGAMIDKFQISYKSVQQGLDQSFSKLQGADMSQFSSNVTKFTEAFETTLKNSPMLKAGLAQGAEATAKGLDSKKKETIASAQAKLAEATKALRESAEDTAKKLGIKMEDLTPKGKK